MSRKPVLYFFTNMPTPYQLDFFSALKHHFDLKVVYFTARESDRQWELSTSGEGYTVQVLKNSRFALWVQKKIPSFHYSKDIFSILKKAQADFVIVNGTYWTPNVVIALYKAYKKKKKVAFWSEPVFPVNNKIRFFIKKTMLWPVFRYSSCLLAIGKQAEEGYRKYGYKKDIYSIPYNININLFKKEALQVEQFQKLVAQFKPGNEIVLLTSGSLIPRKGMDTVIKAFLQMPSEIKARLIIMGDGEEKERLMKLCNNAGNIHFIGFQDKYMVPYWFNLADIFVFASRYDGWGLVINEAVAAGKPVISNKLVGAAVDKLVHLKNAILLNDVESINELSAAMHKLITDTEFRDHIAYNSSLLKEELSSEFNAKNIYDIYQLTK